MTEPRTRPSKYDYTLLKTHLDAFLKVHEYRAAFETYDDKGNASGIVVEVPHPTFVMERGDSVAALLYDREFKEVILVEQFSLPVALRSGPTVGGWMTELAAGALIRDGETPEACMARAIEEETGYRAQNLVEIAEFFVSPGGTTERIKLYFAEVNRTGKVKIVGGNPAKGTYTRVITEKLDDFYSKLRNREYSDAKLIIAGYWLRDRFSGIKYGAASHSVTLRHPVDVPEVSSLFQRYKPKKYVGYISGDIREVRNVDIWVNPLTHHMELDKFTDRTISATLRSAGAVLDKNGLLVADRIGEELRRGKNGRLYVRLGEVVGTTAGALSDRVKRIVHVAIAEGDLNKDPVARIENVGTCVRNVLDYVQTKTWHNSVAIPMLGTGLGGLFVKDVAREIVEAAASYLVANPKCRIDEIYLVPYSAIDVDEVRRAIESEKRLGPAEPRPTSAG
jgi:ADP-ribose pyrophosphatase